MEFYDANNLVQDGIEAKAPRPRVQQCAWVVDQRWCLWGFGLYLIYGDKEEGPFLSTDASGPHPGGSNWCNLFTAIGEPVDCLRGDTISVCCTSHTREKLDPEYELEVAITRAGTAIFSKTLGFEYEDIVRHICMSMQNWRSRWREPKDKYTFGQQ